MRKLLIVSHSELTNDFTHFLSHKHWLCLRAEDPDAACRLHAEHAFLVGLVVFPHARDPLIESMLQQLVRFLPGIKWIAVLAADQAEDLRIKRFIAHCLYDFQLFPIENTRMTTILGHAYGMARIKRELREHETANEPDHFGLIGESPAMQRLYRTIERAADSDVTVLINGPTGTGKELVARAIHQHSQRAHAPFVAINCTAIPSTLLQSELFGHEKGAFTGAHARKAGYIQTAAGGTLFLDEIGDMPMESQASLLRFLEDRLVTSLGSVEGRFVDLRIVASTNIDLEQAIQQKLFRADLYYRLAVLRILTPALNRRDGDIKLLAQHFLREAMLKARTKNLRFSEEALDVMQKYAWPGNVRELRGVITQTVLTCERQVIKPEHLKIPIDFHGHPNATRRHSAIEIDHSSGHAIPGSLKTTRDLSEKRKLEIALAGNARNVTQTARELGISRMTLYRLIAKHHLKASILP